MKVLLSSFLICIFLIISSVSHAADIEWKLFLKPTIAEGPVISRSIGEGQPFIIEKRNMTGPVSGYEDILEMFEGTTFFLQRSPVAGHLSLHIILNVQGDSFESVLGVRVCLNLTIEAYINSIKDDNENLFTNYPVIMTIPTGSGLSALMDQCNCGRSDIVFARYPGGKFTKEGVETSIQVLGIVAYIHSVSTVVGGKYSDFGFSASTGYSTWKKIKTLFQ